MSPTKDPPRYDAAGSGASAGARALLQVSRAEVPDAEQIARLARRLPVGSPSGGGGQAPPRAPASTPVHAAPAAVSIVPSALIGASLAVAVLTGAWWREGATGQAPLVTSPVVASSASEMPRNSGPAPTALGTAPALDPRPPLPSPSPTTRASGGAAIARDPTTVGDVATGRSGSSQAASALDPGNPENETQLLQRAQQSLPRDPAAALAAAEEHRLRFQGGVLAQEREVIAISALGALGRKAEAQSRAARFVESYPRSAHRPGIEALVAGPNSADPARPRE